MTSVKGVGKYIFFAVAAGLLLCNPVTGFSDILPDFLGYWILCLLLYRLSDLNGYVHTAMRRFRLMSLLSLIQVMASYFAYQIISPQATNQYEMRYFVLLGAFLWMLAQLFVALPAFGELFKGLEYLAERHGAQTLTEVRKGKNAIRHFAGITRLFIILGGVLSFLPELSVAHSLDGVGENGTPVYGIEWYSSAIVSQPTLGDRYGFAPLLRVLCAGLFLALAVVWLISLIFFLIKLFREQGWLQTLRHRYEEDVLSQRAMLTVRRISLSLRLMQIALIFSASLYMADREILPGAVMALLLLVSVWSIRDMIPSRAGYTVTYLSLGVVSLLHLGINHAYLLKYTPTDSLYRAQAFRFYRFVQLLGCLEAVLTLAAVIVALCQMIALLRVRNSDTEQSGRTVPYQDVRLRKWIRTRFVTATALFILAATSVIANIFLKLQYPGLWWLCVLLFGVAICMFYSILHEVKTQIVFHFGSDGMNKNI